MTNVMCRARKSMRFSLSLSIYILYISYFYLQYWFIDNVYIQYTIVCFFLRSASVLLLQQVKSKSCPLASYGSVSCWQSCLAVCFWWCFADCVQQRRAHPTVAHLRAGWHLLDCTLAVHVFCWHSCLTALEAASPALTMGKRKDLVISPGNLCQCALHFVETNTCTNIL